MRFSGKTVLITGAATGIGAATARAFAGEGANLVLADIDERAGGVAQEIVAGGGKAVFVPCDVAKRDQVDKAVSRALTEFGSLHAAFNNAGILPPPAPLHEMTGSEFDRIIAVDVKGVFNAMQAEIACFLDAGGGAIVNTASVAGLIADPNMSAYVAAKHAVVGLTKAAAVEYARRGIRVNAIAPGLVATQMTQAWLDDPAFRDAFFTHNVIGRAASPDEIAGSVLHLCSDAASFTNGAVLVIDGGQISH
jgi:NAD(P)-dependent dehydrogenase (short-subunit alcohol dehydrogenase family)